MLELIPAGRRYDFPELVLELLARSQPVGAYRSDAFWLDIGRRDDYELANERFEELRPTLLGLMTDAPWRITLADVSIGRRSGRRWTRCCAPAGSAWAPRRSGSSRPSPRYVGAEHAVAVTNGTAALHLAAAALGLGPGDEVICPALTFVASAAAMRQAGADVRLADSTSLDDFAIDPAELERLASPRTRAVVVLHYGGYPADMESILAVAERRGWYVIEDAAHAPGARLGGAACGTIGDAGCFSFFPNKNMTTGEGGMVVAPRRGRRRPGAQPALARDDDDDVGPAPRPRRELRRRRRRLQLPDRRDASCARPRPALAARRAERRARARLRAGTASSSPAPTGSRCPGSAVAGRRPTTSPRSSRPRSRLAIACGSSYASERIQTSVHYPAIHRFSHYASERGLPTAEAIADRTLTLPLHPGLSREDVETVCAALLDAS